MKQRLIDANELIIDILAHDISDHKRIDRIILDAPTVEAIPIEWLKNDLIPRAEQLGATTYVDNIKFVLEDWEAWKKYRG